MSESPFTTPPNPESFTMTHAVSMLSLTTGRCVRIVKFLAVLTLLVSVSQTHAAGAPGDEPARDEKQREAAGDAPDRKAQMAAMQRIASAINVTAGGESPRELDLISNALFRFHDPARNQSDGSIWGFGKTGRPAALLTLTLHPRSDGTLGWLFELNSLSSGPVTAKLQQPSALWSTRKAGLELKAIPDGPQPAEKESGRTRQLRDLSSRFVGFEFLKKDLTGPFERFQLRLIPRPVYRYSDPEHGLVDGAIFLMTHTTNPEIVMVIEAVRDRDKSVWKYGFTRCAYAEVHVELDGKDVWTQPHVNGTGSSDPYWLFFQPIPGGQLPRDDSDE